MGGVKDREAKKKANKVFSSGGGGGTKGPAVVDKRNQELQCPHCERIFKQIQRYRDHIAKQHADVEQAAAEEAQPAAPPEERVMDVGSRGGAWTLKSPKLLLLEWTQGQKRVKPRYRVLPQEGGRFGCKVVLPDGKDDRQDVVVFLDAGSAAESEEEAQQAGALAALHRVAGDRALHRILPRKHQEGWARLSQQAEARKESAAAREAAAAKHAQRQAASRAAEARRKPQQIVMSGQQESLVAASLAELRGSGGAPASGGATADMLPAQQAQARLRGMGFATEDAAAAAEAAGDAAGVRLSEALDWLCLSLPEERLPRAFASGAARPVELFSRMQRGNGGGQAAAELAGLGYSPAEVAAALARSGGEADVAFAQLFSTLTGQACGSVAGGGESAEWAEEVEAVRAIYGEEAEAPAPSLLRLRLAEGALLLELRAPGDGPYPDHPPLIGVRCDRLPGPTLLRLTCALAAEAQGLAGAPMVHDLALAAAALLQTALEAPDRLPTADEPVAPASAGPADGVEPGDEPEDGCGAAAPQQPGRPARQVRRPEDTAKRRADAERESQRLLQEAQHAPPAAAAARRRLPAFGQREQVLAQLAQQRVLVVSGATGCGKSTQVPQYVLEEAIAARAGGSCNIVCTQPRRISAVGLAQRVSEERGERLGSVVGYSVRFDNRTSARTRLTFCTTGILLRRLLADPDLQGTTHVVVDEVHERSLDSDLLLLLLRSLLARGANAGLRVVLMSATADAELFASYFTSGLQDPGAAGVLHILGFTHPVRDLFLEDALELTGFTIGRGSRWAKQKAAADGGKQAAREEAEAELPRGGGYSAQTLASLKVVDEALINYDLLEALVAAVVARPVWELTGQEGGWDDDEEAAAILVFLPGAPEINRLVRALQHSAALRQAAGDQKLLLLPLHGSLPPGEQARVFARAAPGVRKVVVATNVAETSITIDDVVCVIDSGRAKEMRYDAARGLSRLEEDWVSQASAAQRRGRAGRVRPGVCFKLFSRRQHARLPAQQLPEMLRVPLHQLCLTVKAVLPGAPPIAGTLAQLLTPPQPSAAAGAVDDLRRMGALTGEEALTPLGRHLARMPLDAKLGKALIYAAMLRCLSPMLTIVAALAYGRPVWLSPPDRREEANAAKQQLVASSAAAKSDHLALIAAYNAWEAARRAGGRGEAAKVSASLFVSDAAMDSIWVGRGEYAATLEDLGFVAPGYAAAVRRGEAVGGAGSLDEFSGNARVVKAALAAGFYPSLLRVDHPAAKYTETAGGAFQRDADPVKLRFYDRTKGRVFMHPASVNFNVGRFETPWLVYTDLTETSKVFCREASMVPAYALLLFCGDVAVDHQASLLRLDGWATFKAPARVGVLVKELRAVISELLAQKLADPALDLSRSKAVDAVHRLVATDGF